MSLSAARLTQKQRHHHYNPHNSHHNPHHPHQPHPNHHHHLTPNNHNHQPQPQPQPHQPHQPHQHPQHQHHHNHPHPHLTITTATTTVRTLLKLMERVARRLSQVMLLLAVLCLVLTRASASEVNPSTTLQCHVREYSYPVSKRPVLDELGRVVTCEGIVRINTCWGRCDSYEVGDFQMPFKVSHHPVCTYAGYRRRTVILSDCHGYPDPTIEVLDATACACRPCNSGDTSCENLDG